MSGRKINCRVVSKAETGKMLVYPEALVVGKVAKGV